MPQVRKRVDAALGLKACDVGLDLRQAPDLDAWPTDALVAAVKRQAYAYGSFSLFVAASDVASAHARERLKPVADKLGATLIHLKHPDRRASNLERARYALAQDELLALCDVLLPDAPSLDLAFARHAFRRPKRNTSTCAAPPA